MMRKRSIISLLLAFCLCFSMITPAMAAEVNAEAQIEAQAMSRLADFDFVQSADVNEALYHFVYQYYQVVILGQTFAQLIFPHTLYPYQIYLKYCYNL